MTDVEIAGKIGISRQTIGSDMRVLREAAITTLQTWSEKKLPHELESISIGVRLLLRKAWQVIDDDNSSEKAKLDSRQFALECYKLQRDMIIDKTNIEEGRAIYLRSTVRLETLESLKERQMREAYEEQRRKSQAVF